MAKYDWANSITYWLARWKQYRTEWRGYKRNCAGKREARMMMRWAASNYAKLRGLVPYDNYFGHAMEYKYG